MNTNNEDYRAGFNFIKVCRFLAYLLLALGTWGSFVIAALGWFSQVSAEEKSYTATESISQYPDSEEEKQISSAQPTNTFLPTPPQLSASTSKTIQKLPTVFLAAAILSGTWLSWALMLVFCDFAEAHLQTAKNSKIIIDLLKGNKS